MTAAFAATAGRINSAFRIAAYAGAVRANPAQICAAAMRAVSAAFRAATAAARMNAGGRAAAAGGRGAGIL